MSGTQPERRSPLHERHLEAGARMVPFAGWLMPISYQGIKEEHLAVRNHVGMFDVSHMGQLAVEGPDAERYLQRMLSNDLAKMSDGGAQYSCLCDENGGITDDLFTYRLAEDRYLIVTNAANHATDLAALENGVAGFDCDLRDVAADWAMVAVQGPEARAVVESSLDLDLPPRMKVSQAAIAGAPGLICGTGYTGEDGVELLVAPDRVGEVWDLLAEGGAVPCGLGARDSLRMEVCFHLHGNDIGPDTNPIEAGLGWCCREETGFVGSERIAAIRAAGPERRLVAFRMQGRGIARQGNPVINESGEQIGTVTSGGHSPSLGVGIGMAYVESDLAEPGREIEIDVRGNKRQALLAKKPLYRKEKTTDE